MHSGYFSNEWHKLCSIMGGYRIQRVSYPTGVTNLFLWCIESYKPHGWPQHGKLDSTHNNYIYHHETGELKATLYTDQ